MDQHPTDTASQPAFGAQQLTLDEAFALARGHLEAGRLAQAEALCQNILAVEPRHAATLNLYGLVAYQAGNLPAAIDLIRRGCDADATIALFHCNLAEMLRLSGRLDEALAAGECAVAIDPHYVQALNNLGTIHYLRGEFDQAAARHRAAIAIEPDNASAHSNLGNALRAQGKLDEALKHYENATRLDAAYADGWNNFGTALRDAGRLAESESVYRTALALKPESVMILNNLALAVRDLERPDEAAAILLRSLPLDQANAKTLTYLALVRLDQHRLDEAHDFAQRALAINGGDPETLNAMGLIVAGFDRPSEALDFFHQAIARQPSLAGAYNNIGNTLKQSGDFAQAYEAYVQSIALDPRQSEVYVNLTDLKKVEAGSPYLASMLELAKRIDLLPQTAQIQLNFALAKAYEDLGDFEKAFRHMRDGNALKRRRIHYDEAAAHKLFDRIRATFDQKLIKAKSGGGDDSTLPVFVLGMPRSGTTLIEQIIASHPDAYGAGELTDLSDIVGNVEATYGPSYLFPECIATMGPEDFRALGAHYVRRLRNHSADAARITDKMPANFCFVGLIHLMLPQARIIHVIRDPVDTCLSCYSRLFEALQNHTYDLGELGRYYRKYAELMAHWRAVLPKGRMLDVRYEDVVADLEPQARRIIDYCGLDWNDKCLAFHQTSRPVKTASASQVRRPIYKTSQGRAQAYREFLGPLLKELDGVEV